VRADVHQAVKQSSSQPEGRPLTINHQFIIFVLGFAAVSAISIQGYCTRPLDFQAELRIL
jgi:hypothetical protein